MYDLHGMLDDIYRNLKELHTYCETWWYLLGK